MNSMDDKNIDILLEKSLERVLYGQETIEFVVEEYPAEADELRSCLEAALWLTAQKPTLEPSREFINTSSRRLIARIEREQKPQKESRRSNVPFWQKLLNTRNLAFQLAFVLLLVCSVLFAAGNIALASQNALPGDFLYPVKTSLETAQLTITYSPLEQAELHMKYADRRLEEIQILTSQGKYGKIKIALDNFDQHVTQAIKILQFESLKDASRTAVLASNINRLLLKQAQTLTYLKSIAPAEIHFALQQAIEISQMGAGITQEIIEISNAPGITPLPTNTNSPTILPSDSLTPSDTSIPSKTSPSVTDTLVNPSSTPSPQNTALASSTQPPDTAFPAISTSDPTKTQKIIQVPTEEVNPTLTTKPPKPTKIPKTPKPTKTPKPDKPTKTSKTGASDNPPNPSHPTKPPKPSKTPKKP